MSHKVTVDLPDSVYEAIKQSAQASGRTPSEWIATRLADWLPSQGQFGAGEGSQAETTGAGSQVEPPDGHVEGEQSYHDLDALAGSWSEAEASAFLASIADFEQVDDALWH